MKKLTVPVLVVLGAVLALAACGSAPQEYIRTDSQAGRLEFKVEPSSATVIVDGVVRGQARDFDGTPAILELPEGVHQVVLEAPGYETYTTRVYLSDTMEIVSVVLRKGGGR
jgi:hypothetical protein